MSVHVVCLQQCSAAQPAAYLHNMKARVTANQKASWPTLLSESAAMVVLTIFTAQAHPSSATAAGRLPICMPSGDPVQSHLRNCNVPNTNSRAGPIRPRATCYGCVHCCSAQQTALSGAACDLLAAQQLTQRLACARSCSPRQHSSRC